MVSDAYVPIVNQDQKSVVRVRVQGVNKVTDEQIIKALEKTIHLAEYVDSSYCDGVDILEIKNALDLINRQRGELRKKQVKIHKLLKELNQIQDYYNMQKAEIDRLKTMNSEMCIGMKVLKERAYNNFADRLYKKLGVTKNYAIDEVLREMAGDDK